MATPDLPPARLQQYASNENIALIKCLGDGKDGAVWLTSRRTAAKAHERLESYHAELAAYIRFRALGIREIVGFAIPALRQHSDELYVLEMDFVTPPFAVDFASARLDADPGLIEDEGNTIDDMIRSRFDADEADAVITLRYALISKARIYLSDFHRENVKFK